MRIHKAPIKGSMQIRETLIAVTRKLEEALLLSRIREGASSKRG